MTGPLPELRPHIEKIARAILGGSNTQLSTRQQLRFGTNGNVALEIAGPKRGQWFDHEAAVGGGPWELLAIKGGMTKATAIKWLQSEFGIDIERAALTSRRIVATHDYDDEIGVVLFQVCRFEPKAFRQRKPDGKGGWIWKVRGARQVPYRLPELIAAPTECVVFIVEGEKDADRLAGLGLVATCNAGGAAKRRADGKPGRPKWRPELNPFFQDRDVVIVPDNDAAGRDHARSIAANVAPVAARVRILDLPGLPSKGDVSDWLNAGGSIEELERLAAAAPVFSPADGAEVADQGVTLDDEAEIDRLAALPLLQCDRELPVAAKKLGCLASTLRAAVKARRGKGEATPGQGRPLDLPEPDLWPEPVGGAKLLDELGAAIRRHVVLDAREADVIALWLLSVHAFDAWIIFPRLFVTAPEKQCGKTTLLDVLSRLVTRPLVASGITPAALFRTIEAARPTLLLDEADAYALDNEDLRAVINSGHRRDGIVIRTVGDNHEPCTFSTWAPMALAAIGHLPGTIEDRSIAIRLRRRRSDEPVESLRLDRTGGLDELARKAARWAADHMRGLARSDPAMPDGIYNRAADNWCPLLAVADEAGSDWSERARKAAASLAHDGFEDRESARVLLLADLRELFDSEPSGVLFTKEILAALAKDENRPWPEWKNGKPITDRQLAALLKPFEVRPKSVRRGADTEKGYRREWLDDVFARYLSAPQSVTASQASVSAAFGDLRSVTLVPGVTDAISENSKKSAGCDAVTDRDPLWWRNDDGELPTRDPWEAVWTE